MSQKEVVGDDSGAVVFPCVLLNSLSCYIGLYEAATYNTTTLTDQGERTVFKAYDIWMYMPVIHTCVSYMLYFYSIYEAS